MEIKLKLDNPEPYQISDPGTFLRLSGLLYVINSKILHNFGFSMCIVPKRDGQGKEVVASDGLCEVLILATNDKEGFDCSRDEHEAGKNSYNSFLRVLGSEKLAAHKAALVIKERDL